MGCCDGCNNKSNECLKLAQAKLKSFEKLEKNWDSYGADPPSLNSIDNASAIIGLLSLVKCEHYVVVPCSNGGITVHCNHNGQEFDVDCYNNGVLVTAFSDNDENIVTFGGEHENESE